MAETQQDEVREANEEDTEQAVQSSVPGVFLIPPQIDIPRQWPPKPRLDARTLAFRLGTNMV